MKNQHRKQTRSERQAFIERIKKEMSELYGAYLQREKEKKEKLQILIVEFTDKVFELYKDDLKVQPCS